MKIYLLVICFTFIVFSAFAQQPDEGRKYYFSDISWGGEISSVTKENIKTLIAPYRARFLMLKQIDQLCSDIRATLKKDNASKQPASCAIQKGTLIIILGT